MTLLDAHRVKISAYHSQTGPHLFDLNSDSAGISITDQMRRGHDIIVEALRENIIGPDRPLLVIGAGVAGMMAAVTAASANVTTRVIEKEEGLFTVQANCPSRWVCPTQYSWPDEGWNKGVYPLDQNTMPFVWRRGIADVVTGALREDLEQLISDNQRLKVIRRAKFLRYRLTTDQRGQLRVIPRLDVIPEDPEFPQAFSMTLACTGFGKENTIVQKNVASAPKYTGHIFWQLDKYEEDNPPLGIASGPPRVLISGSGDGALQDFLRIATKLDAASVAGRPSVRRAGSAAALYWLVFKSWSRIQRRIDRRIKDIEERYRRELFGPASRSNDKEIRILNACAASGEAQAQHLTLIKELCNETKVWNGVIDSLDHVVKNLRDDIKLKMVYPCFHLIPYYGLNRFMTLLLVAYSQKRYPDVELLYSGTMVTEVVGNGDHAPPVDTCKDADHCHGRDHRVFCAPADCVSVRAGVIANESEFENGPYNAVIIRHGIFPNSRTQVLSEDRLERPTTD